MPKTPTPHRHSDRRAFDRLMVLIATLVNHPGVGGDAEAGGGGHRDALEAVRLRVREMARSLDIEFPDGYPAAATIRKDLETLRGYGILDRRMYRWGYYLGTGAMSREALRMMVQAFASQAETQGDPAMRRVWKELQKRLRGLDIESDGEFFYPVRSHLDRPIMHTDPEEMLDRGDRKETLFRQLDRVEAAIVGGWAVELSRSRDPYSGTQVGMMSVWPLQLVYRDVAWYLIHESCDTGLLAVGRLDRFGNYCQFIDGMTRSLEEQRAALDDARRLLEHGWGLNLGNLPEQAAELRGELTFERVKVRFFSPVTAFIIEGDRRHPSQRVILGPKDSSGAYQFVDYAVKLPPRSLDEFLLWVNRFADRAKVLSPTSLAKRHRRAASRLLGRYET